MKIFYSVEDVSPGELLPILGGTFHPKPKDFDTPESDFDLESIAEEAGRDYQYQHDGWEHSSWPIEIKLYDEDEKVFGTFSVDRDIEPVFSARKVK